MEDEQAGYLFKDGKLIDFPTIISKNTDYSRETGALRVRVTTKEVNVDFIEEIKPTPEQINAIKRLKLPNKGLFFEIVDKNNNPLRGFGGFNKTFEEMEKQISDFYN